MSPSFQHQHLTYPTVVYPLKNSQEFIFICLVAISFTARFPHSVYGQSQNVEDVKMKRSTRNSIINVTAGRKSKLFSLLLLFSFLCDERPAKNLMCSASRI